MKVENTSDHSILATCILRAHMMCNAKKCLSSIPKVMGLMTVYRKNAGCQPHKNQIDTEQNN